jgi:hypothetical protein
MIPRLRRSHLALGSLVPLMTLPGCAAGHTAAAPHPAAVPRPDLCRVLDRKTVGVALLGKVGGCAADSGADYYAVQFTGNAVVRHHKVPASLTVAYKARYEPGTGLDRWVAFEQPKTGRVRMIGVGDMAIFQATAAPAPQLVVVRKEVILSVALETAKVAVPQDRLPDHLLDVARAALDALPR